MERGKHRKREFGKKGREKTTVTPQLDWEEKKVSRCINKQPHPMKKWWEVWIHPKRREKISCKVVIHYIKNNELDEGEYEKEFHSYSHCKSGRDFSQNKKKEGFCGLLLSSGRGGVLRHMHIWGHGGLANREKTDAWGRGRATYKKKVLPRGNRRRMT